MRNLPYTEFLRKAIHITAVAIPFLYFFLSRELMLALIGLGLLVALMVEWLRRKSPGFRRIFNRYLSSLLRDREQYQLTGATYLIMGFLLAVLLFPRQVAIFGMLVVAVSDALAAVVGRTWGRHRIFREKTLEGTLAFILATFVIALLLFAYPVWMLLIISLIIGVWEMFWQYSADNLVLPILCGFLIKILQYFAG